MLARGLGRSEVFGHTAAVGLVLLRDLDTQLPRLTVLAEAGGNRLSD